MMNSRSTAASLAYRDVRFLDSDDGRPVRILSEYLALFHFADDPDVVLRILQHNIELAGEAPSPAIARSRTT
jgi:hypothetical protein